MHRLIPIAVHDQTLTVCMPGLVQAEVLGLLAAQIDLQVLPFVGSVNSNSRWILENLPEEVPPPLPGDSLGAASVEDPTMTVDPALADAGMGTPPDPDAPGGDGWDNFFDVADAAVLMDLNPEPGDDEDDVAPPLPDLPQIPEPPPSV